MKNRMLLAVRLVLLLIVLQTCNKAMSATLTFTNKDLFPVRIDDLQNNCQGHLIKVPVKLKPNESWTIMGVTEVVQVYRVCGGGMCTDSAIGTKGHGKHYQLSIVLDGDGWITVTSSPDDWVGNINCPK